MKVEDIYVLINSITSEIVGESAILTEDLSNVVDIGREIVNANAIDAYVKKLVNRIGKTVFDDRVYASNVPSVIMDAWEYGSITQKIIANIPDAHSNASWDLVDTQSYDPNVFYEPEIEVKFFNDRVTFEIPMSFTEMQVKQSFNSASEMNGFLSMLRNAVDKSLTLKIDALVMRTINTMIAQTLNHESYDVAYENTGIKKINLLHEYNETAKPDTPLTVEECLTSPEFIRYAVYRIGIISDRLTRMSTLYNVGGKKKFTPKDMQRMVLLSDFKRASDVYLQGDVYHNEKTELPAADIVPYWQASGLSYAFDDCSTIKVEIVNPVYDSNEVDTDKPEYGKKKTVETPPILGVLFDKDSLGVTNLNQRVTTNYNPKAEFYNSWHKFDAGYFADLNENFVVFYVEDVDESNAD